MDYLCQNPGWAGHLKYRGWKTVSVRSADGRHSVQVFILRLLWWPFSMMKVQRSCYDPDFNDLAKIRKKYWVVSSVIEPAKIQNLQSFLKAGYRQSRFPFLATSTYVNDLSKDERVLWKNLSQNARRLIIKNKNIDIDEPDIKTFCKLWGKSSKIWIMTEGEVDNLIKCFDGKVRLVLSKINGECQSGLMIIYSKDTANYYMTWTTEAGRVSGAHYRLVWEEMMKAKKLGYKYFDFQGVYDERWPQKKWRGFTEFKRRFGGRLVRFPGAFSRIL